MPHSGKGDAAITTLVAADIGGTYARFAIADVARGRVLALDREITLKTAEHVTLQAAWEAYGSIVGYPLPSAAAFAVACPVAGDVLKLTNNPWVINRKLISKQLDIDQLLIVNDFAAIGHSVSQLDDSYFSHLCGPRDPLPKIGFISVIGPGTGLGVCGLSRKGADYDILSSEGGHIDFAPVDTFEEKLRKKLYDIYKRVSVERIISGPGLLRIYDIISEIQRGPVISFDNDKALWTLALEGKDPMAVEALERFCLSLGSVAGDIALLHGAAGVIIAGGVGQRLVDHLPQSGFAQRFWAKGRFEERMKRIPVKIITYPQPGLLGAAAAFSSLKPI